MNSQELFLVLTALVDRRMRRAGAGDSAPSSLRLARERIRKAQEQQSKDTAWPELEALFQLSPAPRSRPSRV